MNWRKYMNLEIVFEFLIELEKNNNREWFKENKEFYQNAKLKFEKFIDYLIPQLRKIDTDIDVTSSKQAIFRIFRDIRFSKNKTPYKTNFGAFISEGGRKSLNAGYYIHLEPENSFIGGGVYMPQSKILKSIREEIFENPEIYKKIINNNKFKKYFPEIYGEKLKTAPRGFPKDFKDIELLRNKHFAVAFHVENSYFNEKTIEKILNVFKVQYKFNNYLNNIIKKIS
jgi:uncharacterized protein (TIGR02453 family)